MQLQVCQNFGRGEREALPTAPWRLDSDPSFRMHWCGSGCDLLLAQHIQLID
jgi:hypothetical protein